MVLLLALASCKQSEDVTQEEVVVESEVVTDTIVVEDTVVEPIIRQDEE